jgi:hypothetical protein
VTHTAGVAQWKIVAEARESDYVVSTRWKTLGA